MAQVMAYWRYPSGYNWAAMPTDQGDATVAQLMADCRDQIPSLDDSQDSGTSASTRDIAGGYSWYPSNSGLRSSAFHYASSVSYQSYDLGQVLNDLRASQPVILRGCTDANETDCHAWVCDGYQENCYANDAGSSTCYVKLHMNWGWHERNTRGDYSGWFQAGDWNIPGRNLDFRHVNYMVTGIHL